MLSNELFTIFNQIINESHEMVTAFVDKEDLTGKFDYASIYAQSKDEFGWVDEELRANGTTTDVWGKGHYYLLNEPIETSFGVVRKCTVWQFDPETKERGYLDFEVSNYKSFKGKYISKPNFELISLPHVELVELKAPNYTVRAYFPDGL